MELRKSKETPEDRIKEQKDMRSSRSSSCLNKSATCSPRGFDATGGGLEAAFASHGS